jgi:AraC family transcriptional regulator, transcriptional activator of pobA
MDQQGHPVWEPVEQIVERYLKPDRCHHWPFEPSFPLDVRFLCLNRHHDVPLHRPDHLEIVYLEEGEVGYQVGSRTCMLRPGDIIVVGSNISHRCLRTSFAGSEVHSTVLYFRPELVTPGSPFGDDLRYLLPFSKQDETFRNVIPAESGIASDVLAFLHRISGELPATSDRARFTIRTYLKLILALVGNYYASQRDSCDLMMRSHDDLARLRPLFDHLFLHYADPIRVEDAAGLAAMSPAYFMHFFRKTTGMSFVNYLNKTRITRAQHLLSDTDKSIAEISYEAGFCSQSYFGVVFRRFSGSTAVAYRAQSRQARRSEITN